MVARTFAAFAWFSLAKNAAKLQPFFELKYKRT